MDLLAVLSLMAFWSSNILQVAAAGDGGPCRGNGLLRIGTGDNKIRTGPFQFISRKDWGAKPMRTKPVKKRKAGDYLLVVNGGRKCTTPRSCADVIADEGRQFPEMRGNFYIGGDGNVYEGLGMYKSLDGKYGGLEQYSLVVVFLGDNQEDPPSPLAMKAFLRLGKTAACVGGLRKNYRILSGRVYFNSKHLIGKRLLEELRKLSRYTERVVVPGDYVSGVPFRVISVSGGGVKKGNVVIENVVVRDSGMGQCFTRKACFSLAKEWVEKRGSLTENFYIGGDGNVYEGWGWRSGNYDAMFGKMNYTIVVNFIGHFDSYLPSPRALKAFDQLMKSGIGQGLLSPKYSLYPITDFISSDVVGEKMYETMKKWEHWRSGWD